ncbi:MAG: hypothetical protein K2N73_13795 [Lachnospiraceae bacterium]|nr:hypothetical protein [Lachnospiraceae bacterium]
MKTYLKRLKNPATIIGLSGYILTILSTLGFAVDDDAAMTIIQSICAICVLFGILNNPETSGIDLPTKNK